MVQANLGNSYFWEGKAVGVRADEMEAQRGAHAQAWIPLQKTLRPKPCDWIDYCLPLENPAGHRKANRRIDQMHLPHKHPHFGIDLADPQGRNQHQLISAQYQRGFAPTRPNSAMEVARK